MVCECRLCHGRSLEQMVDFGARPIAHRILADTNEEETEFELALHLCPDCGLIQVSQPIPPELLYKGFNYNFSSWKPEPHMQAELATIMAHGPYRSIFEIGCNDGRFLSEVLTLAGCTGMGVEPNPVPASVARDRRLTIFGSWLTPKVCAEAVAANGGRFDLVLSRQVIEHVVNLDNFFACIDALLSEDGRLFLDMPDFEPALRQADCSAVWEEHVSYFTTPVLNDLLQRHGFRIARSDWYDFSGGCLAVLARRAKPQEKMPAERRSSSVGEIIALARQYDERLRAYQRELRAALDNARARGAHIVIYGVGVRGCCLLNGARMGDRIDFAVDDQPDRQGKFMPGSRLSIRPPSILSESAAPLVCLLAVNNENEQKVIENLSRLVERPVSFLTLCSPKDIGAALAAFRIP